jgi:hypothetical protein
MKPPENLVLIIKLKNDWPIFGLRDFIIVFGKILSLYSKQTAAK